jgi:hypothetical protein
MPVLFVLGVVVDRAWGADAGHDIFTLGVHQPFAVELVVADGRVAGEGHAGGGRVAHVSNYFSCNHEFSTNFIIVFFFKNGWLNRW